MNLRCADDWNIYVSGFSGGPGVLEGGERFLGEKLRITLNPAKKALDRTWNRKFFGYTFMNQHHL